MKFKTLFLSLFSLFLTGCNFEMTYTPIHGNFTPSTSTEEVKPQMATYNFYLSSSYKTSFDSLTRKNVDTPVFSCETKMLAPIGKCPEEINTGAKLLALAKEKGIIDSTNPNDIFPEGTIFEGYSIYPVVVRKENLYDFEFECLGTATVNLYGVWTSGGAN